MAIAIIGGGITGLTTSLALHKLGISSIVYEQSEEINEIGAGIWLQPNAVKVLDWLGIKERILAEGTELNKMEITNRHLQPVKRMKSEIVQDEFGNKTIAIHRGKLQSLLHAAVTERSRVELGKKYLSHEMMAGKYEIQFEGAQKTEADMILGTDGIHSQVRNSIFPNTSLRSSGQVCWRGIANYKLPLHLRNSGKEAWGNRIRFGFSQIAEDKVYWFAVAKENRLAEPGNQTDKNFLMNLFAGFSDSVSEMIGNTDNALIHKAVLADLKRIPSWHSGNICLLGDAAHATTPNMGQGACQGIEDAYYLSNILSRSSSNQAAFKEFESKRRKKVDYIVNTSWTFGKAAHNPVGQAFVKAIIKLMPERMMNKQMNRLYSIENYG